MGAGVPHCLSSAAFATEQQYKPLFENNIHIDDRRLPTVRPKAWRLRGVFFGGAGSGLFGSVRPFWGGCCIVALCKITNKRRSSPPETPLAFCGFFVQDIQKAHFLRASVTLCCRRRGGGKNYFFNGFLAVAVRFGRRRGVWGWIGSSGWVACSQWGGGSVRPIHRCGARAVSLPVSHNAVSKGIPFGTFYNTVPKYVP